MRRLLCATAVSGALLLLGTGCSSGKADEDAAPVAVAPAPAPAAASGPAGPSAGAALPGEADAALSGNTGAICQQAAKTSGDAVRNFALDLKLRIDAESSQDKDLVAKAKEKTSRDVENFAYALKDMSKLAADAKLKAALASMSSQVTALKGDVSKVDSARMVKLRATLDEACGDA